MHDANISRNAHIENIFFQPNLYFEKNQSHIGTHKG